MGSIPIAGNFSALTKVIGWDVLATGVEWLPLNKGGEGKYPRYPAHLSEDNTVG